MDLARMHDWIVRELGKPRPIGDSMAALIDQCEEDRPHPDWAKLRSLPYSDLSALFDWIQLPFREEPADVPLQGLWFGLFNPCPNGRDPVADLYLSGAVRFDSDPQDNEWAVRPHWWPAGRYAQSEILADIYRIAYRQIANSTEKRECLGNDAEYPLCLGYGAFAVRELLERVEPISVLNGAISLGVAVGFDSGDFVLLGEYGPAGFAGQA